MSNTHTPRTDALIDSCGDYEKWEKYRDRLHAFSRSLEIDFNVEVAANDAAIKTIERLKAERDELVKVLHKAMCVGLFPEEDFNEISSILTKYSTERKEK